MIDSNYYNEYLSVSRPRENADGSETACSEMFKKDYNQVVAKAKKDAFFACTHFGLNPANIEADLRKSAEEENKQEPSDIHIAYALQNAFKEAVRANSKSQNIR